MKYFLLTMSLPNPDFLPYNPDSFFQKIKQVQLHTPLNVKTMSTSQWTRVLTEEGLTRAGAQPGHHAVCAQQV